jgi:hypothetical protein
MNGDTGSPLSQNARGHRVPAWYGTVRLLAGVPRRRPSRRVLHTLDGDERFGVGGDDQHGQAGVPGTEQLHDPGRLAQCLAAYGHSVVVIYPALHETSCVPSESNPRQAAEPASENVDQIVQPAGEIRGPGPPGPIDQPGSGIGAA